MNESEKSAYLQMIQEPINRMSTMSAIFKGFCSTTVTGVALIDYTNIGRNILIASFLSILAFVFLDIYYLMLERKFRYLYEQVRINKHECDFDMKTIEFSDMVKMKAAKARVRDCVKSPSIWLFYPIMASIATYCVLKS